MMSWLMRVTFAWVLCLTCWTAPAELACLGGSSLALLGEKSLLLAPAVT